MKLDYCGARYPDNPQLECLMPKGHDGPHAVMSKAKWLEWPNETPPPALGVSVSDSVVSKDKLA